MGSPNRAVSAEASEIPRNIALRAWKSFLEVNQRARVEASKAMRLATDNIAIAVDEIDKLR